MEIPTQPNNPGWQGPQLGGEETQGLLCGGLVSGFLLSQRIKDVACAAETAGGPAGIKNPSLPSFFNPSPSQGA